MQIWISNFYTLMFPFHRSCHIYINLNEYIYVMQHYTYQGSSFTKSSMFTTSVTLFSLLFCCHDLQRYVFWNLKTNINKLKRQNNFIFSNNCKCATTYKNTNAYTVARITRLWLVYPVHLYKVIFYHCVTLCFC
jgi:hypothetical protein